MNRRSFLFRSMMTAAAASSRLAAQGQGTPVVHTASGALRGTSQNGVNVFRGVPFAEPPLGPLHFRPPQPVKPWSGVRPATAFAAAAMQPGGPHPSQSEDCLYLNIWAPADRGPHPVLVWVHGGGFTGGHAFDPLFDGTRFAREGIVCITVAYRLGVFGFLDLGPLLGPEYSGSANNALRDVMLALAWAQENIASFGGDPKRVTIAGESAGAKILDILMGTPAAEPLFQQMISESGGAERIWPAARAAEVAKGFCTEWAKAPNGDCMQLHAANARDLIAAQERFLASWPVHFPLRPEIDGTFIPQAPLSLIRAGSTRRKRLLLGTNRDESALFIGPHPTIDPSAKDLGNLSQTQFAQIEARYLHLYPNMSDELRRIRSLTAEEYWIPSLRVADAHVNAGGQAFVYRLDLAAPTGHWKGYAFHSYDLRFVWDHFGADTPTPEEQHVAVTIHTAWAEFIRSGTPQAPGMPAWPAYTTTTRPTMLLDSSCHVENAPQAAEFAVWNGLLNV